MLAIANVEGTAGETVMVDVVFSNPTGSGFSGISWTMTIEKPGIAEFVGIQLPEWATIVGFEDVLIEIIAPGGFPTPSINLTVIDFTFQLDGVITDEVIATLSLNLINAGDTTIQLGIL